MFVRVSSCRLWGQNWKVRRFFVLSRQKSRRRQKKPFKTKTKTSHHGREKEQSERHRESTRQVETEDEKRRLERLDGVEIRDAERSVEQTPVKISRFQTPVYSERDTSARTEEESERTRQNVLSRERHRILNARTADEHV